ncbi:MAG: prolyl oligopeptidase family serine peptidase, partial [Alphaproteobacteria bacterium]|nr:prolyl oligopeptidase family serine peptidase [Alphaproteobacteria bacterium]
LSAIKAEPIRWKSFDGLEIEGILTYPQGYTEGTKVPLIVSIHGGPSGVESQYFIGSTLFGPYSPAVFSSQGYATLVVNYRGSLGYGEKFQKIDYKDLGGGDFKDIMAGVDYLIDQGIADPHQLFIRGHSYGGFLTAWIISHTDRFKAASIEAEIVDWISHIATTDAPTVMEAYFGGAYWEDYKLWRDSSPLTRVSDMKTPALILHGANDSRVSVTQSMQLYNALKERSIPTRLVAYKGREHSMSDSIATQDAMKEKLKWFKTYGNR